MLQISRALYRQLAPRLLPEAPAAGMERRRQVLLASIEANLERVVREPDFDRPERRLYLDVRTQFPLLELPRVRQIIDRHIGVARAHAEQMRAARLLAEGTCQALRRSGEPCSRLAVTGERYCPSHRHLEEPVDEVLAAAVA